MIENLKLLASEIRAEVEVFEVSYCMIQKRLEDAGLHERRPEKKSFISSKNVKCRLEFALRYMIRRKFFGLMRFDNMYLDDGKMYIQRPMNKPFDY